MFEPGSRPAGLVDARFAVGAQHFHHHADVLLARHTEVANAVLEGLQFGHPVTPITRKRKLRPDGLGTPELNRLIRSNLAEQGEWRFEAVVKDGVIFDASAVGGAVRGFDFARYDRRYNLARLWSLCHGRRRLVGGGKLWDHYVASNPDVANFATEMASNQSGVDVAVPKAIPTVLGEIQFGNWALAYRDIMRVLDADAQVDVDIVVYITASGRLASAISDQTVDYDATRVILQEFSSVVRVPIWLIGLDIDY
jgi:hypothetical protein